MFMDQADHAFFRGMCVLVLLLHTALLQQVLVAAHNGGIQLISALLWVLCYVQFNGLVVVTVGGRYTEHRMHGVVSGLLGGCIIDAALHLPARLTWLPSLRWPLLVLTVSYF